LALTADIFRYLLWQVLGATTVPYVVNNESFIAHDLLSAVDFEKVCFLTRASSARGVSFSSSSLFSSAQVSAPSTPPPRTPVQMPCPHLRANVRFRSPLFLHMLTVPLTPPFPRAISVRGDNAAKPPDGSRSASGATTITTASRATQEVGETRRTRRRTGPRSERA